MPHTFFVTRHAGAQEWAARCGFENAEMVAHFNPTVVEPGDVVMGVLPVELAAAVCSRGGRFFALSMTIPADKRGVELTADDMDDFGAVLREFVITEVK